MARKVERLSFVAVKNARTPGLYPDGAGLYLNVGDTGSKSWLFRYTLSGKAHWMGCGALLDVSLAEARIKAAMLRKQVHLDKVDPLAAKRQAEGALRAERAKAITFEECAAKYITAHKSGWKNAKHASQWDSTLQTYVLPVIANLPVGAIETAHVTAILEPIWATKSETANRVRGRIEVILDYAKVHSWRDGENPARWKGHLDHVLPPRGRVRAVEHHAALDWRHVAAFMADLVAQEGTGARALRFATLTAARTGEVINATWSEMDLDNRTWTIPAHKMKAKKEHRVALSAEAVAVLQEMAPERAQDEGDFVFPGARGGRPISNMTMLLLLRRMKRTDITVHGMRSAFRDWASEQTSHPGDVVEAALAHAVGSKVEAAYRRGDLFDKRRRLMDDWADWCAGNTSAKVVQFNRVAG